MATSTTAVPEPSGERQGLSLAQKVALNSSAQVIRQLLVAFMGVLSVALVSRYLPIEEYGQILTAMAVVTLFSVGGDFGITATTARLIAQQPERREQIMSSALWAWAGFVTATAVVVLAVSWTAYGGADQTLARECVVIILVASTLLLPLFGTASAIAIVEQRVWLLAIGTTLARLIALGVIVLAIVLDLGPIGIAFGFGAGFMLDQLFAAVLVRPEIPLRRPDFERIRSLVGMALPLGLVMIVNGLYFKLDAFLLTLLGSTEDVAIYGIAYRAFEVLIALPSFVMVTLLPELARIGPREPRFGNLMQKAFTAMCLIAAGLAAFALLGDELMTLLGGSKYTQGGLVIGFIILGVAIACVNGVFGNALVAQGLQGALLKVALLNLGLNAAMNAVAIPVWGARGAAVALCISEVTSLICTMLVYRRLADLPRIETPFRLIAALIAMGAAMSVRFLITDEELVRLLIGAAVGLPTYLAALVALRALPTYVAEPALAAIRRLRRGRPRESAQTDT